MADLEQDDLERILTLRQQIQFYGTEEFGYTDSGLWKFLPYVKTKDSHDKKHPIKPFPVADKDYLKVVFLYMLACDRLLNPKSRQIMMSWAFAAFDIWTAMGGPCRQVVYQTKKETDAFAMVTGGKKKPGDGRMDFIIQRLPGWLKDANIASGAGNNVGELVFSPDEIDSDGLICPWFGSRIEAVPGGSDQVAGKTMTKLTEDEARYQENFMSVISIAMPALMGGGQLHVGSSVRRGTDFNALVLETIDGGPPVHEVHPAVARGLEILGIPWPKGMKSWQTKSGFWALETHYTADPAKDPERDGKQWFIKASSEYPGGVDGDDWQQEMEINYHAKGGRLVFEHLSSPFPRCYVKSFDPQSIMLKWNFVAGYDYGTTNPSAFEVTAIDELGQLYVVWEVYEPCTNIARHVQLIKSCPYWEKLEYIAADNKIFSRNQQAANGLKAVSELFGEHGLYMSPARQGVDYTMALKLNTEYWADPENPRAFITDAAPGLKSELRELRMQQHKSALVAQDKNDPEKIVAKNNHAFDAWTYSLDFRPHPLRQTKQVDPNLTIAAFIKKAENQRRSESRRRGGIIVA